MKRNNFLFGLGVYAVRGRVHLFYNNSNPQISQLSMDVSHDGFTFAPFGGKPTIVDENKGIIDPRTCSDFRISHVGKQYIVVFVSGGKTHIATSKDLVQWSVKASLEVTFGSQTEQISESGMIVPDFTVKGYSVLYFGSGAIRVGVSKNLKNWKANRSPILSPRQNMFDEGPLSVASVYETDKGIALFYYVHSNCANSDCYAIGSALFDKKDPQKLIWRSESPILEHVEGFAEKSVRPIGIINRNEMLLSYWDISEDGIVAIAHPLNRHADRPADKKFKLVLNRIAENPILRPITSHLWESKAVFNPAAMYDNGKVHLIYRALGDNDVSVLGYAASDDGVTFDERLNEPIYVPRTDFEGLHCDAPNGEYASPFFSGGAYGGCEDPRITKIDGKIYMMYVAYDGAHPPRVALSSISENDFYDRKWNKWAQPVLVSPPGVVDKNACILPEKINGKYVIFHRIYPHILVDYVDDLDFDGKTKFLVGQHSISPKRDSWDSRKIGVGATPIKTKYGWLLIYQSVGEQDPSRYKMGAMILDADRPEKVLFRSKKPILGPDMWYENEGFKAGVAYPCGAVIKDEDLFVYYGGADTVICAARANADQFLHKMTSSEDAELIPAKIHVKRG